MGSRVHDALEWLYDQVRNSRKPSTKEVISAYQNGWEEEWSNDIRVVKKGFIADDYRAVGEQCLRTFCARHEPYQEGIVLGLEEGFQIALDESTVLNGFIDRLMKVDGDIYEVHDYKTSQRLPTPDQAQADEQGSWYALAVRDRFPQASEIRLVWHYLRHDEQLKTTRSDQELELLKEDIARRIAAIEAETVFPAQESGLCNWCDYFGICPAKGHQLAVEDLLENEYMNEPGVVLVNRLEELKAKLRDVEDESGAEIDQVKEALLHYARENGYSVIVGDTKEAVVDIKDVLSLPAKLAPEREELDEAIRQLGLWDDFSNLSTSQLSMALREGSLSKDQQERLESFAKSETRETVRLRKRST